MCSLVINPEHVKIGLKIRWTMFRIDFDRMFVIVTLYN